MSDRRVRKLAANQAAGTEIECHGYETAIIQVKNLSGGDTLAVSGTVDHANYVTMSVTNLVTNASATSITADGVYSCPALEFLKHTQTGSASTPSVSYLLKA